MSAHSSDALVIELDPTYGPGQLAPALERAGLQMHLVQPHRGDQVPTDLRRMEGLVVLGGALHAHDDSRVPHLRAVRALLRTARGRNLPTLGIGLGAQLLALALEGRIGPARARDAGKLLRLTELTLTDAGRTDPLLSALAEHPVGMDIAGDGVRSLPPGSTLLATDARGGVQAFRTEEVLWGLQFHPEADEALVRAAVGSTACLPSPGDPVRAAWTALLDAFADQVRTG